MRILGVDPNKLTHVAWVGGATDKSQHREANDPIPVATRSGRRGSS